MTWSPARPRQSVSPPTLTAQVETIQGKRAAVNPDVMRERLRARLVQEGKITNKATYSSASRPRTAAPIPTRPSGS